MKITFGLRLFVTVFCVWCMGNYFTYYYVMLYGILNGFESFLVHYGFPSAILKWNGGHLKAGKLSLSSKLIMEIKRKRLILALSIVLRKFFTTKCNRQNNVSNFLHENCITNFWKLYPFIETNHAMLYISL